MGVMQWIRLSTLYICLGASVFGCAAKVHDLKTAQGTIEEGTRLIKDEFYDEARKQFLRVKTEFPDSGLQAKADLRIADSYFEEESYAVAATSYQDFLKTYPSRPEAPYALYRMALSYAKQMPSNAQRDSRNTRKVLDTFTRLLVDYPNSKYAPEAIKWMKVAQNLLAEKSFDIAVFYEKQNNFAAAANRYKEVVELYADNPLAEEAMANEIICLRKAGKNNVADEVTKEFQAKYPSSKYTSRIQP